MRCIYLNVAAVSELAPPRLLEIASETLESHRVKLHADRETGLAPSSKRGLIFGSSDGEEGEERAVS